MMVPPVIEPMLEMVMPDPRTIGEALEHPRMCPAIPAIGVEIAEGPMRMMISKAHRYRRRRSGRGETKGSAAQ
jgi:hypothetical protein